MKENIAIAVLLALMAAPIVAGIAALYAAPYGFTIRISSANGFEFIPWEKPDAE